MSGNHRLTGGGRPPIGLTLAVLQQMIYKQEPLRSPLLRPVRVSRGGVVFTDDWQPFVTLVAGEHGEWRRSWPVWT